MQDVALFINEVKRDNETIQKIKLIERSITDLQMPQNTTLMMYGKLHRDGLVHVKSPEKRASLPRHVFLFDKVLLICKAKGADFRYKEALSLSKFKVEDKDKVNRTQSSNGHQYYPYAPGGRGHGEG
jgi:guanine nucleotide exchange factor VAV